MTGACVCHNGHSARMYDAVIERKADAVSGEQTTRQWRVLVSGGAQTDVRPGERVEIGRKPIRPLADDGMPRFEVTDATRSMSKRHAVFSVTEGGLAMLRDLDSTNGSYMVRDDGSLIRLPSGVDFPLPASPIRVQFGDVPVDFVRVESITPEPQVEVPDLFNYAPSHARQEPDAADMSVDDILDLRAGEPTTAFQTPSASTAAAAPLHVGRHAGAAESAEEAQLQTDLLASADDDHQEQSPDSMPLNVVEAAHDGSQAPETAPRDLFVDAMSAGVAEPDGQSDAVQPGTEQESAGKPAVQAGMPQNEQTQPMQSGNTRSQETQPETQTHENRPQIQPQGVQQQTAQPQEVQFRPLQQEQTAPSTAVHTEPLNDTATPETTRSDAAEGVTGSAFTPAFEPGSVFERVSRGEMKAATPAVEVDGMTSEDARHSTDFKLQYEMARHEELQPFLAMNPALYDDLYAWLAAQGNRDIDEALARNEGYREYRNAVRK